MAGQRFRAGGRSGAGAAEVCVGVAGRALAVAGRACDVRQPGMATVQGVCNKNATVLHLVVPLVSTVCTVL